MSTSYTVCPKRYAVPDKTLFHKMQKKLELRIVYGYRHKINYTTYDINKQQH